MAAPIGNQFWKLRSKHGRDKLFRSPEMLWEATTEYFEWCDANPLLEEKVFHSQGIITKDTLSRMRAYTLEGLCLYLNANTAYFRQFETDNEQQDFSTVITRIRETIYNQKFSGAAADLLNPNIIARDLGLSDKKDVSLDGNINIPPIEWTKK